MGYKSFSTDHIQFSCSFDKNDIKKLRKLSNEINLDMRDIVRAGLKRILPVKERKKIINILNNQ